MFALHRYFIQADEMRKLFGLTLNKVTTADDRDTDTDSIARSIYMGLWYGSLCVVVEGWGKLKLCDPTIEILLASPYVTLLRKYRNGVFHYQPTYYDERFFGFMRKEDTPEWVHTLHLEFGRYFLGWFADRRAAAGGYYYRTIPSKR